MATSFGPGKCWSVINLGNTQLLLKTLFDNVECAYKISLFDGLNFWEENVLIEQFKIKCKEFNPKVEADPVYLLQELKQNCENYVKNEAKFELKKDDRNSDHCELSIKFKLQAGVPFNWKFIFCKGSEEAISNQLILPMLSMLCEFQRQNSELLKIIEKKDTEIQDYKEQGISPSKKNIETCRFDSKAFKEDSLTAKAISSVTAQPMSAFSNRESKILYEHIMKHNCKMSNEAAKDTMETQTCGMQSLQTQQQEENTCHAVSQPSESAKIDVVDEELKRRVLIEKRLSHHKQKDGSNAKRSRKINL